MRRDLAEAVENGRISEKDYEAGMDALDALESTEGIGEEFSISEITGQKQNYGIGVILDTNLFDGVKPRNWDRVLRRYVYESMAGKELTMYDEDGNAETVLLARENDRVRKDGAKNSHRVIDKMARTGGNNIKALAVVHLSELLETSGNETATDEHSHQWLDENGWTLRTVYMQDPTGNIYEATLNIANGRDRRILYDVSNIRRIDKSTTGGDVSSALAGGTRSTSRSASGQYDTTNPGEVKEQNSISEKTDADYLDAVRRGDIETAQRMVDEAARAAMPKSVIRDRDGRLQYVYHGTEADFYTFDPTVQGGVNGTAEGFGIYLSTDPEVTKHYGERQLRMYANVTHPARSDRKTLTARQLKALIKKTCEAEARRLVDEDEYGSAKVLLLDDIKKEEASSSAASAVTLLPTADNYPSASSKISVADLLDLVKGDAAKYIPQRTDRTDAIMLPGNEEYSITERETMPKKAQDVLERAERQGR